MSKSGRAQTSALQLARVAAANQEELIGSARHLPIVLAKTPAVRVLNAQVYADFFADLMTEYSHPTFFWGASSADGNLICSGGPANADHAGDYAYVHVIVHTRLRGRE